MKRQSDSEESPKKRRKNEVCHNSSEDDEVPSRKQRVCSSSEDEADENAVLLADKEQLGGFNYGVDSPGKAEMDEAHLFKLHDLVDTFDPDHAYMLPDVVDGFKKKHGPDYELLYQMLLMKIPPLAWPTQDFLTHFPDFPEDLFDSMEPPDIVDFDLLSDFLPDAEEEDIAPILESSYTDPLQFLVEDSSNFQVLNFVFNQTDWEPMLDVFGNGLDARKSGFIPAYYLWFQLVKLHRSIPLGDDSEIGKLYRQGKDNEICELLRNGREKGWNPNRTSLSVVFAWTESIVKRWYSLVHSDVSTYKAFRGLWNFPLDFRCRISDKDEKLSHSSLLMLAAHYDKIPLVLHLCTDKADINLNSGAFNDTVIFYAAREENIRILRILATHGADLNAVTKFSQVWDTDTPLLLECIGLELTQVVQELVFLDVDFRYNGKFGPERDSALEVALKCGVEEAIEKGWKRRKEVLQTCFKKQEEWFTHTVLEYLNPLEKEVFAKFRVQDELEEFEGEFSEDSYSEGEPVSDGEQEGFVVDDE